MRIFGLKTLVAQEIGGKTYSANTIIAVHQNEEVLKQQLPHILPGQKQKPTLAVVPMEAVEV